MGRDDVPGGPGFLANQIAPNAPRRPCLSGPASTAGRLADGASRVTGPEHLEPSTRAGEERFS